MTKKEYELYKNTTEKIIRGEKITGEEKDALAAHISETEKMLEDIRCKDKND